MAGKSLFDVSLLELFNAELEVHLPALGEGLLALERDPRQPKVLEALMRAAHSIKGAAKIIGVEAAVRLAHAMEDTFVAAQKGETVLTPATADALLRGVDALGQARPTADDPDGSASLPASRVAELVAAITAARTGAAPLPPPAPEPPPVLDAGRAERLRADAAEQLRRGESVVNLDMGAATDADPTGLAFLAQLAGSAARRTPRPTLQLANVAPPLRDLLRLTGLEAAYRLAPARDSSPSS